MVMLGASCSPCCGDNCPADGKPRTDPKDEGTWVPSGSWPSVTWTFQANPGDESGETWFFYGSVGTSKKGGSANATEQADWGNVCNWYSHKTTSPSTAVSIPDLSKRATKLPPENAIVHIYTDINAASVGPVTVKTAYFWGGRLLSPSVLTTTGTAHGTSFGAVFVSGDSVFRPRNFGTVGGGATFFLFAENAGTVNGGARFYDDAQTSGTVGGGATFTERAKNLGTVSGGATFSGSTNCYNFGTVHGGATFEVNAYNSATVNDGAIFNGNTRNFGTVNGGAQFNSSSRNEVTVNGGASFSGTTQNRDVVNGGAVFSGSSFNVYVVYGGATFGESSTNQGSVYSGATFNGSSVNGNSGIVYGGATFNDSACSVRSIGSFFATPCTRKFVAHPTDLPTCNGSAPIGCDPLGFSCGCG